MSDDLAVRLRSPWWAFSPTIDATIREAADRIEQQDAIIAAIDALHQPMQANGHSIYCTCGRKLPCPTRRIIHEGAAP